MFAAKKIERKVEKQNLAKGANFSIDVVTEDDYTHSVQITHLPSNRIAQTLPIDPTDCTVVGMLSKEGLEMFADEAEAICKTLSHVLLNELGAKELIIIPDSHLLPEFVAPEHSGFERFRHCDRADFNMHTLAILSEYTELVASMDERFHFVTDEKSLLSDNDPTERYQAIHDILEKARFTADKNNEYKNEDIQGKMSRFKNKCVRPLVMLDENNQIAGMIRILLMGERFAYLSDEVVDQSILPLEYFTGTSEEEKFYLREKFLLAYLMQQACKLGLADIDHLFIIAAKGREGIYDQVGYESFPAALSGYKAVMKFSQPRPALIALQEGIKSLPAPEKARSLLGYGT